MREGRANFIVLWARHTLLFEHGVIGLQPGVAESEEGNRFNGLSGGENR
jgi:hypothetical protein